jgi:hypothetical protein
MVACCGDADEAAPVNAAVKAREWGGGANLNDESMEQSIVGFWKAETQMNESSYPKI